MSKNINTKSISIESCTSIATETMPVKLFNGGRLISIDVHLKNVCPNQNLILGVLICYKNSPYAIQTQKIHTEKISRCHCTCLKDLSAKNFEFIFPFEICLKDISIKIIAHYLY